MKKRFTLILLLIPFLLYSQKENDILEPGAATKEQGYVNFTSFGKLIGSENDKQTYISSFHIEHNYQVNKHFALGLITGIDWFDVALAPVGPNIKLILPQKNKSAFYAGGSAGHSFPLEEMELEYINITDTKGGTFTNIQIGYIIPLKGNVRLFMSSGYRYQVFSFIREDWWLREVERKTTYNRFSISLGVMLR